MLSVSASSNELFVSSNVTLVYNYFKMNMKIDKIHGFYNCISNFASLYIENYKVVENVDRHVRSMLR